jgi:hypothetical protein
MNFLTMKLESRPLQWDVMQLRETAFAALTRNPLHTKHQSTRRKGRHVDRDGEGAQCIMPVR